MSEQEPGIPGQTGAAAEPPPPPPADAPTTVMATPAAAPPPTAPVVPAATTTGGGGNRNVLILSALILVAVILAAAFVISQAGSPDASPAPSAVAPTSAPSAVTPTAAPATPAPATPAPTPTPNACAPENLATVAAGSLTIGADNPAYPPYFEISDSATPPWELGDPTNGKGFESAVAYAVADRLGFAADKVAWTVVPFNNSYAPGPKSFDFFITQVSATPERAQTVDLSDGYYFVNQAVVAPKDSPIASVTSTADLAPFKFGAQVGTTSYQTIIDTIKPTQEPSVFDTNDAAIEALKNGQIDALVVDLPTAFYVTAVQFDSGVIVGQFPAPPEGEHFSLVLAKDSPLTVCVNQALAAMTADGTLDGITKTWLSDKANAPVFTP